MKEIGQIKDHGYAPQKDRSLTFITFSVLSFFVGFGMVIGFYGYTFISFFALSQFIVAFAVLGFLIPLKYYQKWFHFIKYEMIVFNILGVAPLLSGLFLCLNFLLSYDPKQYDFEVIGLEQTNGTVVFKLKNDRPFLPDKAYDFSSLTYTEIVHKKTLLITIEQGVFGFEVIKNREFK